MARGWRQAHASERGFTLIELVMAMAIMAIGLIALVASTDTSRDLVTNSEKIETATHQAEQAVERILSLPYGNVALSALPSSSTDSTDPRFYVNGSNYTWDQGATGPQSEPLVVDAANSQVASSYNWTDGTTRLSGVVHQFVTRTGDRCPTGITGCPAGNQTAKRVTVAVTVNGSKPLRRPVLVSTLMIDPTATG